MNTQNSRRFVRTFIVPLGDQERAAKFNKINVTYIAYIRDLDLDKGHYVPNPYNTYYSHITVI